MDKTSHLPVNEVFETIQGEATHAGRPAVFVRLQGCDVGCPWCDTKFTWELTERDVVSFDDILAKRSSSSRAYARVDQDELTTRIVSHPFRAGHIVITGGEPAMHDLSRFTAALLDLGRSVQIETSGTSIIRVDPRAWVTLSPKIDMPGGLIVYPSAVERANEIKMPVGRPRDIAKLKDFLHEYAVDPAKPVWLQPLSTSEKATSLCTEAATANGWRLSVQTHKFIGVR